MLTGPSRSIFALQRGDRLFRGHRGRGVDGRALDDSGAGVVAAGRTVVSSSASGSGSPPQWPRRPASPRRSLHLLDVARAPRRASSARHRRTSAPDARVAFGRCSRHLELTGLARESPRARARASRITASCASTVARSAGGRFIRRRAASHASPRGRECRRRAPRSPSAIAAMQRLARLVGLLQLAASRRDSLLQIARALLEPQHVGGERRARVRPARRARPVPPPPGPERIDRFARSASRRWAWPSVSSASRCSSRAARSTPRPPRGELERRALLFGPPPSRARSLRALRVSRTVSSAARPAAPRADDRLLLAVLLVLAAPAMALAPARSSASSSATSSARRVSASRSTATRSRSSLISRRVARMPRDSTLAPPDTRCGPRSTSPSIVAIGARLSRANATACVERLGDIASGRTL